MAVAYHSPSIGEGMRLDFNSWKGWGDSRKEAYLNLTAASSMGNPAL